jgi:dihydrodipicolinate synthase/N-acetylneuraminate lyase
MKLVRFDGCWTAKLAKDNVFVIAGTGSNSTKEALRGHETHRRDWGPSGFACGLLL